MTTGMNESVVEADSVCVSTGLKCSKIKNNLPKDEDEHMSVDHNQKRGLLSNIAGLEDDESPPMFGRPHQRGSYLSDGFVVTRPRR